MFKQVHFVGVCAFALVIAAFVLVSNTYAVPPTVGPQIRIDVNGGTEAANETSAAASQLDPTRIVGTWNDWRNSGGNEVINMGVALSLDGGTTWDDFLVRPPAANQSGVEGDPMAAWDPRTGTLWVGAISFSGNGGVYVARLNPGDTEFQDSVMANTGGGEDKCWMAAGPRPGLPNTTRLYVGFNQGLVWSDDMGDTWNFPVPLGPGLGWLPRIGPNGVLYLSYWDFIDETFKIKRSLDGGHNFTTHTIAQRMDTWGVEVNNTRFPGTFRVPAIPALAVDPNNGTLYSVYADTTEIIGGNSNVDIYFSTSNNQGTTWSTPQIAIEIEHNTSDQFFPWIEVDATGRLHMLWFDTRHVAQNDNQLHGWIDAYYAYSQDSGANWNEIRLTPASWDSENDGLNRPAQFIGDYLGMGVTENQAFPVYLDSSNGDTDTFTNVITFGNPCPWDLDESGTVDTVDLLALFANWGAPGPTDFDESGVTDTVDLLLLFANWGPCP